jgi:hypothetical protein
MPVDTYDLRAYSVPARLFLIGLLLTNQRGRGFQLIILPLTQIIQHRSQMQDWWKIGKTSLLGETPVTIPIYSPQTQYSMAWVRTQVFVVICHRITAWTMVRLPVQSYRVNLSRQTISVVAREYYNNLKPSHCRQKSFLGTLVLHCAIYTKFQRIILTKYCTLQQSFGNL